MQTSYVIADPQFQECEHNDHPMPLPQMRGIGGAGSPCVHDGVSRLAFLAQPSDREIATSQKIQASITYMSQHLNQPLQVSALASMVNISPSHYFALFKRHSGRAPMDYFTRLRMERACRLLDTTGSSVKEVAAALGYDDPFYFSRVFKSVQGVAPSEYRAQRANSSPVDFKGKHASKESPAVCLPSQPPGALLVRDDEGREKLSRKRFGSPAPHSNSLHSNSPKPSSNPNQTSPVPGHP